MRPLDSLYLNLINSKLFILKEFLMGVISNITRNFFNLSSNTEAVEAVNDSRKERSEGCTRFSSESQMEQLSKKIISHLELHHNSNVTLIFSSEQADIIGRVLRVLHSYHDRIRVMTLEKSMGILSGLAQRAVSCVNVNDMVVQVQKGTVVVLLNKECVPASTELNDSIFIGCYESDRLARSENRTKAVRDIYQELPSTNTLQIYAHRSEITLL
jgi:hypothetical protein